MIAFIFQVVAISLSGAMAPGPMTAVTVGKGSESARAGIWIALGHSIVEIPLMVAILYGLGVIIENPPVKLTIFVVGSIFLFLMGWDMFAGLRQSDVNRIDSKHSPLVSGIFLSAANPYFLIWWATIGAALLLQARVFGWMGFVVFAVVHSLCDLIWLSFLSFASNRGGQTFGTLFQKIVFVICGLFLFFFSVKFLLDGIQILQN